MNLNETREGKLKRVKISLDKFHFFVNEIDIETFPVSKCGVTKVSITKFRKKISPWRGS